MDRPDDRAIDLLRQAIKDNPRNLECYLLLGDIFNGREDYPSTAKIYRDALKIDDLPPSLRQQLEKQTSAMESKNRAN